MGWIIAFSVFFTFLIGKILYGMRKEIWEALNLRYNKNYFLKKQIQESKEVDELLDWKLKLKDKELLKEIDRQLDKVEKRRG